MIDKLIKRAQCRREGVSRGNCHGACKKLKLFSPAICCNDIKVKFRRGPVSSSYPGPVLALGGPESPPLV